MCDVRLLLEEREQLRVVHWQRDVRVQRRGDLHRCVYKLAQHLYGVR